MIGWRGILSLVLLAAALLSGWAVWTQRAPEPPSGPASGRSDYQLYDFDLIVLEDDGSEAFTLRAPHMARRPGDLSMSLQAPLFLFPAGDTGQDRWEVRAQEGRVSADGDEIRLLHNVQAHGPGSNGNRTRLQSEELVAFPKRQIVIAPTTATVHQGAIRLSAQYFLFDLKRNTVHMKNNVKASVEP
jgi:lipopolysaccharide export system protein LptC